MESTAIESLLECSVCFEVFQDPRSLPCGHVFCLACIQSLVDRDKSSTDLLCPLCNNVWNASSDTDSLPKNFVINYIIGYLPEMAACAMLLDSGDNSDHGKAEYFCVDCWDPLCITCRDCHSRTKQTRNHVVKKRSEINKEDVDKHKKHKAAMNALLDDIDGELMSQVNKSLDAMKSSLDKLVSSKSHVEPLIMQMDDLQAEVDKFAGELRYKIKITCDNFLQNADNTISQIATEINQQIIDERGQVNDTITEVDKKILQVQDTIGRYESHLSSSTSAINRATLLDESSSIKNDFNFELWDDNNAIAIKFRQVADWKNNVQLWWQRVNEALAIPFPQLNCPFITDKKRQTDVLSLQWLQSLSAGQSKRSCNDKINCMSVRSRKLMMGAWQSSDLFVYDKSSLNLEKTISVPGKLRDAVWTSTGHVVCTTDNSRVTLMTEDGAIIKQTSMFYPHYLTSCADGTLLVADRENGVYQSLDGGASWNCLLKLANGWKVSQVIKVQSIDNQQYLWTLEDNGSQRRIHKYGIVDTVVTSGDNDVFNSVPSLPDLNFVYSRLVSTSDVILVSDHNAAAVHVISSSGHYISKLAVTRPDNVCKPCGLAIDEGERRLYVGDVSNVINIFNIT